MNWFREAGIEPQNVSSCNSLATMLRLVAAGHGVAVMSLAIMRAEIESGLIQTLVAKPRLKQEKYLVAYQAERSGSGIETIVHLTTQILARSEVLVPWAAPK